MSFLGIGKIFNVIRTVAPFLQFIPALAPFVKLFQIADQVANLVKNFKNGFSFLDLVTKFAPMPKAFGQSGLGGCFGLNSGKLDVFKNLLGESSSAYKALNLANETVGNWNHINSERTNSFYGSFISPTAN